MATRNAALLSIALFGNAGCGSTPPVGSATEAFVGAPVQTLTSRGGVYSVAIRTSPSVPALGNDSVQYTITDAATGAPAPGLSLSIVPWMPAMGHGTSLVPSVMETSPGIYLVTQVGLFMPGAWVLRTTISVTQAGSSSDPDAPSASDYVEPSFEIS